MTKRNEIDSLTSLVVPPTDNDVDKQVKDLDQRIAQHCQRFGRYDETLFNLGAELGRLLEKSKLPEHRPPVFIKFEAENEAYEKKAAQIKRVDDVIAFLIRNAVAMQVENSGEFRFDSTLGLYGCQKLADEVVEKFSVQVGRTIQPERGASFVTELEISGDVAAVLNRHGIQLFAQADVDNTSSNGHETIYDANDVDRIFSANLPLPPYLDESQLIALADDLDKEMVKVIFTLKNPR